MNNKLQKQNDLIEKINEAFKPGDKIKVKLDDGTIVEWTMRHPATLMGGHSAVIWAEEHTGCYAAGRLQF